MKQKTLAIAVSILLLCLISMSFAEKEPKVLIIGDSISMGYTSHIKKGLAGKAQVFHNPGNAQHSGFGVQKVKEWVGEGDWDVIQFNWGLWDLCYRSTDSPVQGGRDKINGQITNSIDVYRANLDSIVTIMKQETKAKLIFITTSYVPEDEEGRFYEDAMEYNDAAIEVMEKHGVQVLDIYDESASIHRNYGMGSDNVHFKKEGYQQLANVILPVLKKLLNIEE